MVSSRFVELGVGCAAVTLAAAVTVSAARAPRPSKGDFVALACPDDDAAAACKVLASRTTEVQCESDHEGPAPTSFLTCDPRPVVRIAWRTADGGNDALTGRVSESGRDAGTFWTCVDGERTLYVDPPSDEAPSARAAFERVCETLRETLR